MILIATFAVTFLHAAQGADVTSHLVNLGQPLTTFYGSAASSKRGIYDMATIDGRLYLSHGTSNNATPHKMLFYSPTINGSGAWAQDLDANGQAYRFNEERTEGLYVFDGRLHMLGYDPFAPNPTNGAVGSPQSKIYRRDDDGIWRGYDITPDAHNKQLGYNNGRYFVTYGVAPTPYPGIRTTTNLGTMASVVQPAATLPSGSTVSEYGAFFNVAGLTYSTTQRLASNGSESPQPWMIRYNATTHRFDSVFQSASEFLGAAGTPVNNVSPTVNSPTTLPSGRLVFSVGSALGYADAIAPNAAVIVDPAPAAFRYTDIEVVPNGLLALAQSRDFASNGLTYNHRIYFSRDGADWAEIARFSQLNIDTKYLNYLDGDLYFGGDVYTNFVPSDIRFHRLSGQYFTIPEPGTALTLAAVGLAACARRRGVR
jgi:hypothetical protein